MSTDERENKRFAGLSLEITLKTVSSARGPPTRRQGFDGWWEGENAIMLNGSNLLNKQLLLPGETDSFKVRKTKINWILLAPIQHFLCRSMILGYQVVAPKQLPRARRLEKVIRV